MQRLLKAYDSQAAEDADSAWEALVEVNDVHLLIADLDLLVNSCALMERIRSAQDPLLKAMPVLALVNDDDDESSQQRGLDCGVSDFLHLPFSSVELKHRVGRFLEQYEKLREEQLLSIGSSFQQDAFNGVLRRDGMLQRLEQELALFYRHKTPFTLVALRLNAYLEVAQRFNPRSAELVMKQMAQMLNNTIRREDVLGYCGEGVFLLLYPVTNGLGGITGARRLQQRLLQQTVRVKGAVVDMHFFAALMTANLEMPDKAEAFLTLLQNKLQQAISTQEAEILA